MEYVAYLEIIWEYFPYLFYTFVFLTLIPKSIRKIINFADADYKANRNKFHRCYGPDLCCHTFADESPQPKQTKQRKAVTRVYPKRHSTVELPSFTREPTNNIKRQVPASSIHVRTNVNQIAKMFENSVHSTEHKKINRVMPTILPEIRMFTEDDEREKMIEIDIEDTERNDRKDRKDRNDKIEKYFEKKSSRMTPTQLHENIENSVNLLNQVANDLQNNSNWNSDSMQVKRRARAIPTKLTYAGTSATPSTASPAASSSPSSSSPHSSPTSSPVRRNAPTLILKSSFEDIFAAIAQNAEHEHEHENFIYAGCQTLSPVTSIDDILSQRRLSRPLSAYSISDLLNEENAAGKDETYVENFLRTVNKT